MSIFAPLSWCSARGSWVPTDDGPAFGGMTGVAARAGARVPRLSSDDGDERCASLESEQVGTVLPADRGATAATPDDPYVPGRKAAQDVTLPGPHVS